MDTAVICSTVLTASLYFFTAARRSAPCATKEMMQPLPDATCTSSLWTGRSAPCAILKEMACRQHIGQRLRHLLSLSAGRSRAVHVAIIDYHQW